MGLVFLRMGAHCYLEFRLPKISSQMEIKNTDDPYDTFNSFRDVVRYPPTPRFQCWEAQFGKSTCELISGMSAMERSEKHRTHYRSTAKIRIVSAIESSVTQKTLQILNEYANF